jgi:phosphoribosyl 1,2-cyclic phosphodiesterase
MRVTVLASGSSGNAVLVEADGTRVLVDAGLVPRKLDQRFERTQLDVKLDDVQAVIATHEHGDHAVGVAGLVSAGIAAYATPGTARALGLPSVREISAGVRFEIGALSIEPVSVPHDSAEPVAFLLSDGVSRVGVLVDVGHIDAELAETFAGCDVLLLEANYDSDLLRLGQYPPTLKRRIASRVGHLSNEQTAEALRLMTRAARPRPLPRVLVLGHLSLQNNRPRLARVAVERAVPAGSRPTTLIAPADRPLAPIELIGGKVKILPQADQRQLTLAFGD